nr:hypothetical protein [uncultured Bacillus sp.]
MQNTVTEESIVVLKKYGAKGWASQHVLLRLQPNHGAATVALNSSAHYLGSAIGSSLGGIVMLARLRLLNFHLLQVV